MTSSFRQGRGGFEAPREAATGECALYVILHTSPRTSLPGSPNQHPHEWAPQPLLRRYSGTAGCQAKSGGGGERRQRRWRALGKSRQVTARTMRSQRYC